MTSEKKNTNNFSIWSAQNFLKDKKKSGERLLGKSNYRINVQKEAISIIWQNKMFFLFFPSSATESKDIAKELNEWMNEWWKEEKNGEKIDGNSICFL